MSDESYNRVINGIKRQVEHLNTMLGYETNPLLGDCITFGYIGNLEGDRDYRSWMVFLPHPGRVGTENDCLGGFRTGDIEAAQRTAVQLAGIIQFASWQAEARGRAGR